MVYKSTNLEIVKFLSIDYRCRHCIGFSLTDTFRSLLLNRALKFDEVDWKEQIRRVLTNEASSESLCLPTSSDRHWKKFVARFFTHSGFHDSHNFNKSGWLLVTSVEEIKMSVCCFSFSLLSEALACHSSSIIQPRFSEQSILCHDFWKGGPSLCSGQPIERGTIN